jgi:hypothetical protein
MITQYFITFVIPLVFSSLVAAFGWFAYEEIGAIAAGVTSFLLSATWSNFAVISARLNPNSTPSNNRRRVEAQISLTAKRA